MLIWAMIGVACLFPPASTTAIAAILSILVAMIGLPHGAADHRFAQTRLQPILGQAWPLVFLGGYLLIAATVLCGWLLAPTATIVCFFFVSAWHFGQEEPQLAIGPKTLRPFLRFARGGLVIWVPFLFQPDRVVEILTITGSRNFAANASQTVSLFNTFAWLMFAFAAFGWGWQCWAAFCSIGRTRRALLLDNTLVASLVVLFATTSPLVSFPIYFCAWHSIRGLRRLRRELGESWSQLVMSLAPMTLSAIGMILMAAFFMLQAPMLSDSLIRITFVGLSTVAVPHVLLHGTGPLIKTIANRRITSLQLGSST